MDRANSQAESEYVIRFGGPGQPSIPRYTRYNDNCIQHDRICILTFPLQPASEKWTVLDNQKRRPNYPYLRARYGHHVVQPTGRTEPMRFEEFLNSMEAGEEIYLRDWHLLRECQKEGDEESFYTTPQWVADDWLNAYLDTDGDDDYRFVYMGASGTCTTLHVDVFNSFSWSANICGIKKWTFFPPFQSAYLTNARGDTIADIRTASPTEFPAFHMHTTPIIIYQRPGELVFVPSRWYHQVENIGETISINHNWCNARNIDTIFENLETDLAYIRNAIGEHRIEMGEDEWDPHCQMMLRANNAGFGYEMLWDFLVFHAGRLLMLKDQGRHRSSVPPWEDEDAVADGMKKVTALWARLMKDEWAALHPTSDEHLALFRRLEYEVLTQDQRRSAALTGTDCELLC
ncbi:hypothetical protein PhCBS80983_g04389 [Powellomyces hirtus]|uniref:JmjC domain-containing protein n=1 Tax=Powellomyces hirtus TaxID=109895 RepID=A0A507DXX5_9FUNG|nr:hypothetical protein PhCBS80983_g04389 [Powellomyces hirtus]